MDEPDALEALHALRPALRAALASPSAPRAEAALCRLACQSERLLVEGLGDAVPTEAAELVSELLGALEACAGRHIAAAAKIIPRAAASAAAVRPTAERGKLHV